MNISQLRYVLGVADAASLREASTRLYVSQPALSASVRELENELGLRIFDRNRKGISLTDEGREFLTYAKKVVGQYEVLEERYLSKKDDKERFSVSAQHYSFALRAFEEVIRKKNPEKYMFSFHETKTREVLRNVRDYVSEVGIVSFSGGNEGLMKKLFRDDHLEFSPLMRRETFAYVWETHPFAGRKEVSIREMQAFPCISFDQSDDSPFYISEEAMADFAFDKMIKTDDRATSMELLAKLDGYSIGCGMLAEEGAVLKGLTAIKLAEEDPLILGYLVRKDSLLSEYGRAYVEELQRYREIE